MLESMSKQYLTFLSLFTLGLMSCVLLVNCVIDPLWYFRGNVITGKNFTFNERVSKLNHFFKNPEAYDCFIFGSSRVTLLDERKVEGHSCFNFSWAMGRIGEFTMYASYLKKNGYYPKLVVVGVAGFDFEFISKERRKRVVDFIANNALPSSFWTRYLSLDALRFSIDTLRGLSPSPRFYKSDLSGGIQCNAPRYYPGRVGGIAELEGSNKFTLKPVRWYRKLVETFPDAKFVFYVAPVSVWAIRALEENGNLDIYLRALYSVSTMAPVFYDFSIPSDITADPSRTYDGDHYDAAVNELIVDAINSGAPKFGVKITGLSYKGYRKQYLDALRNQEAPVDSRPGDGSTAGHCVSSA